MKRLRLVLLILMILSLLPLSAQARVGPRTLRGRIQVQWGDDQSHQTDAFILYADDGNSYQLNLTEAQKATLPANQRTTVQIEVTSQVSSTLTVSSVVLDAVQTTEVQPALLQDHPRRYLNALCLFPGTVEPHPWTWYTGLISQIDKFWYKEAGIHIESDSTTWGTMPEAVSAYLVQNDQGDWVPLFQKISDACYGAIAGQVSDITVYDGINFFFSQDIGCCAWGGGIQLTGIAKGFAATWMPPWSWLFAGSAHEVGHSLGLPHSGGPGGAAYGNRFDIMSDAWTDCDRALDIEYGCAPQGTIYQQLQRLQALPANRFKVVREQGPDTLTLKLASHFQPDATLPPDYLYGVNLDEYQYGNQFGITLEYRDNTLSYDTKLPVSGVVVHESARFPNYRPDPEHLMVQGAGATVDDLVWTTGEKLTWSFVTMCVLSEDGWGATVRIGLNGVDCASPPPPASGKATGLVLYDLAIVITEDMDVATLPQEIVVGVYREEKPEKLMAVVTLEITPYQRNQYVGAWDKCDKEGKYFIKGSVGQVNVTNSTIHLNCSKKFVPFAQHN